MADNLPSPFEENPSESLTAAVGSAPKSPIISNLGRSTTAKEYFTATHTEKENHMNLPQEQSPAMTQDTWGQLFQNLVEHLTPKTPDTPGISGRGRKMKFSEIYIPSFDPDECQFMAVQWCEEIEHHKTHNSWTDYEARNAAFTHLEGRAKKWATRSYAQCKTWSDLKDKLCGQFAAARRFQDLYRDMADYTSDQAASYLEYSSTKVALIDRLDTGWSEANKIEVVISGIVDMQIATSLMEAHFEPREQPPGANEVEKAYWRAVLLATDHIVANTASIDTGEEGYRFPKDPEAEYGTHPWNLKVTGLTGRKSAVCPEHALRMLETKKHKNVDLATLEFLAAHSTSALEDMLERLDRGEVAQRLQAE